MRLLLNSFQSTRRLYVGMATGRGDGPVFFE
jgi:hypothetical protein